MSTVGIYAECSALSPEEPRHYNQHKAKHLLTTIRLRTTSTCVCRSCGTSSRTDPRPKTTIPPHAFAASAEPTPDNSPQHIYLYLPFLFNCMTMHEVEVGGVSQETLTRRFPRLHFYGCSAGGSPRRPLPEGSLDHIRHWALHLPPGPTWHSSNHLAKSCSALLAESMGPVPMDSANLMRRHSERNEKRMRLPLMRNQLPTTSTV